MERRKHLRRLGVIYQSQPRYFITICTYKRRPMLTRPGVHDILCNHWGKSLDLYGWAIGSYIVMPDHAHFFCTDTESKTPLSKMIGSWKQWTAKEVCPILGVQPPFWQKEFFDHLIRSAESYSDKWEYVRQNPVRAGLVDHVDDWDYAGHVHYA